MRTKRVRVSKLRAGMKISRGVAYNGETHTIESVERSGGISHVTFTDAFEANGMRYRSSDWCDESTVLVVED